MISLSIHSSIFWPLMHYVVVVNLEPVSESTEQGPHRAGTTRTHARTHTDKQTHTEGSLKMPIHLNACFGL